MTAADRPTSVPDAASEPVAGTLSLSLAASVERLRRVEAAASRVVRWVDGGGLLEPWPNASGLVDLRAALSPTPMPPMPPTPSVPTKEGTADAADQ